MVRHMGDKLLLTRTYGLRSAAYLGLVPIKIRAASGGAEPRAAPLHLADTLAGIRESTIHPHFKIILCSEPACIPFL